jgi:HAD superfamily hydrolase (TIGR01450 family)
MTLVAAPHGRTEYDGLIVDLDGVVWLGATPIDGAVDALGALRARGIPIAFVTNDPQSSREGFATRLSAMGVPTTAEDVVTSAAALARHLASDGGMPGRNIFVVGGPALVAEIEGVGLTVVPVIEASRADVVVVGGHEAFDYAELTAATKAISRGAALYATGRDAVFPTSEGPLPATGALLASIEVAGGVTATVIGKPEPFMFEIARDLLVGCRRVAVVGDHLDSDVGGAKRAGLDAILVLTGATTASELATAAVKPDLVVPSLAALVTGTLGPETRDPSSRATGGGKGTVRIERASHDDAPELVPMFEWLFAPPGSRPETWDAEGAAAALARASASEDSAVFVAREARLGVGMCTVYLDIDSVRFGRRAWLEDLMVHPDRRSRGVGKLLLDAAKAWARYHGATHLELDSADGRIDAHRFYERERPQSRSICFGWEL